MKILFLYTELAGYFLASVKKFMELYGVEVHIVRWKVNEEAPFEFNELGNINIYERDNFSTKQLIELADKISPNMIYVSGWADKAYVKVCKKYSKKIPVLAALDNQWFGTLKQRIATLISPFTLKRYFTHIFAAGLYQFEYARRLGFKKENIFIGMYSSDLDLFEKVYFENLEEKKKNYPKQLLYVGRFTEFKGLEELWKAFEELYEEGFTEWTLKCVGAGDTIGYFPDHPAISRSGFVQPNELPQLAKDSGAFILPSRYEPWGVVLHEFAAAGLPLISSDACGSRTAFLRNYFNGFYFKAGNKDSLKNKLHKLMSLSDKELIKMAERSHKMAFTITPEKWATTVYQLMEK